MFSHCELVQSTERIFRNIIMQNDFQKRYEQRTRPQKETQNHQNIKKENHRYMCVWIEYWKLPIITLDGWSIKGSWSDFFSLYLFMYYYFFRSLVNFLVILVVMNTECITTEYFFLSPHCIDGIIAIEKILNAPYTRRPVIVFLTVIVILRIVIGKCALS